MPKAKRGQFSQSLRIDAWKKPKEKTYTVKIQGSGYTAAGLKILFEALEATQDESTFMTFPVIRENEDPALMAELDRRLAEIDSGQAELIPWETVKKNLLARVKTRKKAALKKR